MQVKKVINSPTSITLTISGEPEELRKIKDHALTHLAGSVKVAGFREGKAPLSVIEKNVDPNRLSAEFVDEAINTLYVQAISEQKLRPVANPKVELLKLVPFTTLEFSAEIEVVGEITLPDYKNVKIEAKKNSEVTSKDVEEVISSLQTRLAEKKDVDRAAKDTDQVWIDFKGTDEKGEAIKGADGKDYPLVLGSKTFIPGFEENVVGLKAGESKTFEVTFPADYGVKALQSKKVTFNVTVTKVQEVVKPEVDDSFAAKAGPFKAVSELKEDIKKQLGFEREQQAQRDYEDELVRAIAKNTKVEIPASLIDEQVEYSLRELKNNLMYRGQTAPEYFESQGMTEEEYKVSIRPEAEERVRAGLALSEISEIEKIDVTPEELEIQIQMLKGQYTDAAMQAEIDKTENRRDIVARMMTQKTVERLVQLNAKG